jgi:hypothetical protein
MQGFQKTISGLVLAAFFLVTVSVICLASGQPSAMTDCGHQISAGMMCPFMSVSIPAIVTASLGKAMVMILVLVLMFIVVAVVNGNDHLERASLFRSRSGTGLPPVSFLNSTLKLISEGVLHPRVFSF